MKPIINENFADNGAHSHWSVIDFETGHILIEDIAESAKKPAIEANVNNEQHQCLNCGGFYMGDICPQCKNVVS